MSRWRLSLCFLLLTFAALPARAQNVYGATDLRLNTDLDYAYGYSVTTLDYYACYYYDAVVAGTLYEGTTAMHSGYYHGKCTAEVYTEWPTQDNLLYTQYSEHYIIAYYYYYDYGLQFFDPWGFFGFGSGDHGGDFHYFGCYCPAYFAQSTQDLGSTQVTLLNPGAADPKLVVSPAPVTRGSSATFSITNSQRGDVVSGWSFSDGTNRSVTTDSTATSWSGIMVTGGTVSVNVRRGTGNFQLSKSITVNPRSNFSFPAKPVTKRPNAPPILSCGGEKLEVPDPPTSNTGNDTFGKFVVCLSYSSGTFTEVQSGPNRGYFYVTSPVDSSEAGWTITPQMEDTASDLYRAQCGRDGYISGAQLKTNIVEHESGGNSHYSRYVAAQNDPANNVKAGLEPLVSPPTEPTATFSANVSKEINDRIARIKAATAEEPCGSSDVRLSPLDRCADLGEINLMPYRPCSPLSLTAPVVKSNQVDLSWTDGSFNEQGFRVQRRDDPGQAWTTLTPAAGVTGTTFTDTTVAASHAYVYRVFAFNTTHTSASSNEVRVTTPAAPGSTPPPTQPAYLGGSASPGQINLGWTDSSSDEDGFKIERSANGGPFAEIASVGAGITWYSDTSIDFNTTYTYQVRAWNAGGASAPSPPVTVTSLPPGSAPNAPCCVWGYAYNGIGSLTIYWSDQSSNEDNFVVERNDGWGYFYDVGWTAPNATTYTDYGLQKGQTYVYRIRAENAWGASYSEEMYYNPGRSSK